MDNAVSCGTVFHVCLPWVAGGLSMGTQLVVSRNSQVDSKVLALYDKALGCDKVFHVRHPCTLRIGSRRPTRREQGCGGWLEMVRRPGVVANS